MAVDGLAKAIQLTDCRDPERWILSEDEALYEAAFRVGGSRENAAEIILTRFLETHALVGLKDILDRYPFEAEWAEKKLQSWAGLGRVIPVQADGAATDPQWALPDHLRQVQRTSLAIRRREVIPCPPEQFADFLLRWQYLHPANHRAGDDGLEDVLARLEGIALSPAMWERWVLPARLSGYQSVLLDALIESGERLWACRSDGLDDSPAVSFFRPQTFCEVTGPGAVAEAVPDPNQARVLDFLQKRGATFVTDIAQGVDLAPGIVRAVLWSLLRAGVTTNDRFEVVRRGEDSFRLPVLAPLRPGRYALYAGFSTTAYWSSWRRPLVALAAPHNRPRKACSWPGSLALEPIRHREPRARPDGCFSPSLSARFTESWVRWN